MVLVCFIVKKVISMIKDDVCVVIPAFNEEKRIIPTIRYLRSNGFNNIVVVDDGSSDNTVLVVDGLECLLISNRVNMGKGFSVRNGLFYALKSFSANFFLVYDADSSSKLNFFDDIDSYSEFDLLITSRNRPDSVVINDKPSRRFISKVFNLLVKLFLRLDYSDSQNGCVMFSRFFAEEFLVFGSVNGFCFTLDYLMLAEKYGFKIVEIPVTWVDTIDSRVRVVRDSFKMFLEVLKIRFKWGKI